MNWTNRIEGREETAGELAVQWLTAGRSADDIAATLGTSGDAVRSYVRRQRLRPDATPGPIVLAGTEADAPEDTDGANGYLLRRVAQLEAKTRRMADATGAVCAAVTAAMDAPRYPAAITPPEQPGANYHPHVAVLLCGDIQAGTVVDVPGSAGTAVGYSWDTFIQRAGRWAGTAVKMANIHRASYPVDVAEIVMLGDLVEGETIFPSQGFSTDTNLLAQVIEGSRVIADALAYIKNAGGFREVRVRWAGQGNHGRPGQKGFGHPSTNWDTVFAHHTALYLQNVPGISHTFAAGPFMAWRMPECPAFTWLAVHGDHVGRGNAALRRSRKDYSALTGLHIDYLLIGDKHVTEYADDCMGSVYTNGNWVGGTDYSARHLQSAGDAKQSMMIVHPEHGITALHHLFLERMKPLAEGPGGMLTPCLDPPGTVEARAFMEYA